MASYSPKINDRILLGGHTGRFVIVGLDVPRMTADVRSTSGDGFLLKGVPWEAISELEEGQDSAPGPGRAVREARKSNGHSPTQWSEIFALHLSPLFDELRQSLNVGVC
jgi:hypothetical protein